MTKPKKGKNFVYQLRALLKVRRIREEQQKEVYTKAQQTVDEEMKKEQELINLQQSKYVELVDLMESGEIEDLNEITLRKHHIEQLKEKIIEQTKVREDAEKIKDEEKDKLTQAMIKRQIIEKDEEKTKEAWKKLMEKEDGKFMDEIATIGFENKRRKAEEDYKLWLKKQEEDI